MICTSLLLLLAVSVLFIAGVVVLVDNVFPDVLRPYRMLEAMDAEIAIANTEIAGLKAQLAMLDNKVGRWGSIKQAGE